jgi:NADP-dependent alcohol dehydrogenase
LIKDNTVFNFTYFNPTKIVLGKGTIAQLSSLIPAGKKVMLTFGGGSIKKNGVYEQVITALKGYSLVEFGGIEANPHYETLMKAVELARQTEIDFLLPVGGGSVFDGTKFIAAAIPFTEGDPWRIVVERGAPITKAVPLGGVLTLPATGSEMNNGAVITRISTQEKLNFGHDLVYPVFSILDPETTYSLPLRQVANGIVDTFVHVLEQYVTFPVNAPLQDRQAEAIMQTLIEEAPKLMANPTDYDSRANLMWCATQALNGLIGCGVPQDWATHMIGHELTAFYGIDHGQSLAVVMPALWKYLRDQKCAKLVQYAERVWGVRSGTDEIRAEAGIELTAKFFRSLGVPTTLKEYGIGPDAGKRVGERFAQRGTHLGEKRNVGAKETEEILALCYE